ncbi:unnamed protein product [Calypogeia fissa]
MDLGDNASTVSILELGDLQARLQSFALPPRPMTWEDLQGGMGRFTTGLDVPAAIVDGLQSSDTEVQDSDDQVRQEEVLDSTEAIREDCPLAMVAIPEVVATCDEEILTKIADGEIDVKPAVLKEELTVWNPLDRPTPIAKKGCRSVAGFCMGRKHER